MKDENPRNPLIVCLRSQITPQSNLPVVSASKNSKLHQNEERNKQSTYYGLVPIALSLDSYTVKEPISKKRSTA